MAHFLESVRCDSHLFPSQHGTLISLPSTTSVKTALIKMTEMGISGVPVTHPAAGDQTAIHSWFTLLDVVVAATELAKDDQEVPEGFFAMEIGKIAPLKEETFVTIPSDSLLLEGAKLMVSKNVHRIAVGMGHKGEQAPLTGIITDTRLGRILLACGESDPTKPWHQTLRNRGLVGNREPICVSMDAPVLQAFEKMRANGVRSVAVIEKDFETTKVLCGVVSASDLARLLVADIRDKLDALKSLPAELKLTTKEFLQWRDAANDHRPAQHPSNLIYATAEDTVEDTLKTMVANEVHKLFLVNAHMNIIGVITMFDLLKQYLPQE